MGIGDFGVGQGGNPYTYNTTEFLGNFSWTSLNLANGGNPDFTDQLNVVLQFVQSGTTYDYWIQDVAIMDSSNGELEFENNIWNFTTSSYCLSNSALKGNGTVYSLSGCEGYYAVGASSQPGAVEDMPSPGDFSLLVRSYLSTTGLPEVAFEYWDGVTSYEVTYDNVVWPWAKSVTLDSGFYVNGNATAPSGNFLDAELSLGGPGGGSSTVAGSTTDANSRLLYWNGHNLEAPRAVWNFGGDTAETVSNAQSFFDHDAGGTPLTTQLNGTTRNATPALAYSQGRVGVLAISATGLSSGTVSVDGTEWAFATGEATLTLVPGTYTVWVNSSSEKNDLGACEISGGQTTTVALPGTCSTPPLSTTTPTGTPASVDVGQSVVFQTTLTNPGSGGDTFNWGSLAAGLGCASSTTDSISCSPTASGTYAVSVTVTDSDGDSYTSGTLQYTVYADPTVGTPSGTPSSVDVGQSVVFQTTVTNAGSGGDTFSWNVPSSGLGCASSTTDSISCLPTGAGQYAVKVTVTDSNGKSYTSGSLQYTVDSDPTVGPPTANLSSAETGEAVSFSVSPAGGSGGYNFVWTDLPTPCTGSGTATVDCRPSVSGSYSISVSVTDSNGYTVTSPPLGFTVVGGPSVTTPTASPSADVDLGSSVQLSATASGGVSPYSFVWQNLPAGCASENSSSISCLATANGTFSISVKVTDSKGGEASSTPLAFTVNPVLHLGSLTSSPSEADLGSDVTFSAMDVTGGSGDYQYAWSGLPLGCSAVDNASIVCAPRATGTFALSVTVSDGDGSNVTAGTNLTIVPDPSVARIVDSRDSVDVGQNVVFAAGGVTGGLGAYTFVWSNLPPGCTSENSSSLSCTPTGAGNFTVTVTVTDQDHFSGERSQQYAVRTLPTVASASASSSSIPTGEILGLAAKATGGSGGLTYNWSGLPPGCESINSSALECNPTTAGSYVVVVTVEDSNGGSATGPPIAIVVTSSSSGSPSPAFSPLLEDLLFTGIVVALCALVVLVSTRKKVPPRRIQ